MSDPYDLTEEEQAELNAELEEGYADIESKWVVLLRIDTGKPDSRYAVDTQKGFENVIVVDNIPIVDESKRQRLVERLRQVFDKAGAGLDEDRIAMPWDDEKATNKG
jgi:translation initiation factor 3 subunit B